MKLRNAEKRLLIAVSQIIENEGFSKIGVNKIAKQAKCDKVLIYRYFSGLEGLLAAWAKDNDFYTLAYQAYSERVTKAESSEDIIKLTQTVLLKQLNFLRTNKLMQELLAWELSGNSTFRSIQNERERNGFKLQEELEKKLGKESKDVRMFITILIASINYIVLTTRQYRIFNGIDFSNPEAWEFYASKLFINTFVHFLKIS
jgi:AcrR family transcriptional regulator